jgi:hypothetical protein
MLTASYAHSEIARVEMLRQLKVTDTKRLDNYVDSFESQILGLQYVRYALLVTACIVLLSKNGGAAVHWRDRCVILDMFEVSKLNYKRCRGTASATSISAGVSAPDEDWSGRSCPAATCPSPPIKQSGWVVRWYVIKIPQTME